MLISSRSSRHWKTRLQQFERQEGYMLVESLVVIGLFAITSVAITLSLVTLFDNVGRADSNSIASQVALEELERLAAIDPSTLSEANNTSTTVDREGKSFQQEVEISVNADESRTIAVTVTDNNDKYEVGSTVSNTFPLWGSL